MRFAAVGQLIFLVVIIARRDFRLKPLFILGLTVCLSAYLLLTAPIPNHYYGAFRGILLLLTELAPFIFWVFALTLLKEDFHPKQWPITAKALIALTFIWFVYFFMFKKGVGVMHQVIHGIELLLLLHIAFESAKALRDDLVEQRRKIRIQLLTYLCLHFSLITLLEFTDSATRDNPTFSLINVTLILLGISTFSWLLLKPEQDPKPAVDQNPKLKTVQLNQSIYRWSIKGPTATCVYLWMRVNLPNRIWVSANWPLSCHYQNTNCENSSTNI